MLPHALAGNLEPTATNLIGIPLGLNSQIVWPITIRLWIPNLSMLGKLPGDFWNIPAGVSALSFKGHSSTSAVNLKFKSYSVIVRYENAFSFGFWTNLFGFEHSHVIKDYFGPTRVSSFHVCIILIFVHHLNGCIVVEDVECFNTLSVSLNCSRTFLRATERAVSHVIRYKARNVATCFFCGFFFFFDWIMSKCVRNPSGFDVHGFDTSGPNTTALKNEPHGFSYSQCVRWPSHSCSDTG